MASALAALIIWTLVIWIGTRAKRKQRVRQLAAARAVSKNQDRTHGKGPGWDQDYPWVHVDGVLDDLDEEG